MKKRYTEFKLLILGSELSGKTTFFKQMQLSHGTNPSISDRKSYSLPIIRAIFLGIQRLIKVVQRHHLGKENKLKNVVCPRIACIFVQKIHRHIQNHAI